MSDLRTMMTEAAGAPPVTDSRTVDADLTRAHRALRRRRIGRIGSSSGLVAVAAVGALAIAVPGVLPGVADAPAPIASGPSSPSGPATTTVSGTALVAYTGKQPAGYTLDKVPAGWKVSSSNLDVLVLAPEDSAEEPAEGEPGVVSFIGKIVVMQSGEASLPTGVPTDKIIVNGQPGFIAHMKGAGDTRTLFVKQPSGNYLTIQVWDGLGWSNSQTVEFAGGVHVSEDATVGQG